MLGSPDTIIIRLYYQGGGIISISYNEILYNEIQHQRDVLFMWHTSIKHRSFKQYTESIIIITT